MSEQSVPFECPVEVNKDGVILRPTGEVDMSTSPLLKKLATKIIDEGATRLALDLSRVEFLDSTGLGALVVILKRVRDKGGNLCLFGASEQVQGLLSMTGLDTVFHLEIAEASAFEYLTSDDAAATRVHSARTL